MKLLIFIIQYLVAQSFAQTTESEAPAPAPPATASESSPSPSPAPSSGSRGSSPSIGDFLWVTPKDKTRNQLYKAGTTLRFEWKVTPDSMSLPNNCSIEIRAGAWDKPEVKWTTIADQIPCEGYYDWDIPPNQFASRLYVAKLSTKQTSPLIRDRVTEPFQIYQGTPIVDGNIVTPDSGSVNAVSGLTIMLLLVTLLMK